MRHVTTAVAGLALTAVLLAGCGGDDGASTTASPPTTSATATSQQEAAPTGVKVAIGDNFYEPADVTVRRGQSISWRNDGAAAHTVTSDSDSSVKFDSGVLEPGGAYVLKPSADGRLTYFCTIHGKAQSGTVTVTR